MLILFLEMNNQYGIVSHHYYLVVYWIILIFFLVVLPGTSTNTVTIGDEQIQEGPMEVPQPQSYEYNNYPAAV